MNPAIFKLFGIAVLFFEAVLVFTGVFALPRLAMSPQQVFAGQLLLFGFAIGATLIGVGLICLHRWAAVTASILGVIWSLALAYALGHRPFDALFVGAPVIFGMLLPLYCTIRAWPVLKPVGEFTLTPSFRDLRSLGPLRLK